ncbi:MAG: hypothetical protein ABR611_12665, partial [Chthoniobacterales bacterium]
MSLELSIQIFYLVARIGSNKLYGTIGYLPANAKGYNVLLAGIYDEHATNCLFRKRGEFRRIVGLQELQIAGGVADRAPECVAALAYLDAFLPEDGQSLFDINIPANSQRFIAQAGENGGLSVPAPSAAFFNVNAADAARVDAPSTGASGHLTIFVGREQATAGAVELQHFADHDRPRGHVDAKRQRIG